MEDSASGMTRLVSVDMGDRVSSLPCQFSPNTPQVTWHGPYQLIRVAVSSPCLEHFLFLLCLPPDTTHSSKIAIYVKWVYILKLNPDGDITKYKERLVAKMFLQRPRIDFNKLYAPVSRLETIRIVMAIVAYKG